MIWVKMHVREGERLLAACDEELLGMTFREGDMRLRVSEAFYKGETVTEETLAERMKNATIMNLVGERAVSAAQRAGYVSEGTVIIIDSVKHAQAVLM
jgi:hypothetical protein